MQDFVLDQISFPVGRTESLFLTPLSFSEYLSVAATSPIFKAFKKIAPYDLITEIPSMLHQELLGHLRTFFRIGGMPKVAISFLESRDYSIASKTQSLILQGYRDDFLKYGDNVDFLALNLVFEK